MRKEPIVDLHILVAVEREYLHCWNVRCRSEKSSARVRIQRNLDCPLFLRNPPMVNKPFLVNKAFLPRQTECLSLGYRHRIAIPLRTGHNPTQHGYERTAYWFENSGVANVFDKYLEELVTLASDRPVNVLEVSTRSYLMQRVCQTSRASLYMCRIGQPGRR